MAETFTSLEPTFADAIMTISAATDLIEEKRRHWRSSLTGIAKAFDQPAAVIPARFSAVRARMAGLHHVPLGWTPKTLANHRANAKAALLWFTKEKELQPHGVALSPAWERLCVQLTDPSTRYRLTPLMRFCSGIQVGPEAVTEVAIDRFVEFRSRTSTRPTDAASRRVLARLWNSCMGKIEGWPATLLVEPPPKVADGPQWEDFSEALRADIEHHLTSLNQVRRNKAGHRIRPCKPSTITMRRRELVAAAKMAVIAGVQLAGLDSLNALLQPVVAEKILDGYWAKDGETPGTYTINLAGRFVALAHSLGSIDEDGLQRLEDLRFALEEHRDDGMTSKNLKLIRSVLTDGVWSRIVNLPDQLMRQARLERHAPVKAAVLAQIAVAVAILTFAPIRLGNLAAIRLGENLVKPGGPDSTYWLQFAKQDVKNGVALQFKFDETLTEIIDEYVHDFRPSLVRGNNADWLFPGDDGDHKEQISFSTQIVDRVERSTGLRITVHQFRHAAGALILKHRPGEYELVRRFLGHKSVQTTIKFYLALESTQASEIFTDIIRKNLGAKRDAA